MSENPRSFEELLRQLESRMVEAERAAAHLDEQATKARWEADHLAQTIASIQRVLEAEAEPPRQRQPRRDIRAMVKEQMDQWGWADYDPARMAEQLGCRKSQVEAAVAYWQNANGEENH